MLFGGDLIRGARPSVRRVAVSIRTTLLFKSELLL